MKKISIRKYVSMLGCSLLLLCLPSLVSASSDLQVSIEVIKADRNSTNVDSELKELVKELTPVLNYTGFSLVKKSVTRLSASQTDDVKLSSGRLLELQFRGFEKNQARLQVRILEKKKETFRTVVLLVDKGSVLIGGPLYEGGVLLLRLSGEFK